MKTLLTLLLILTLLTACAPAAPDTPADAPDEPTDEQQPDTPADTPDEPTDEQQPDTTPPTAPLILPLTLGETKKATNTLTISFTKILTDSRCPIDATCIWQGETTAELVLRNTNPQPGQDSRRTIQLSTQQPTTAWDWTLHLTDVRPSASTGRTILQREYSITLAIAGNDATPPGTPTLQTLGQPCHGFDQRCADTLACSGLYHNTPGTCIPEQDAKTQCETHNATWGRWGLLGQTYCNQPLPDAGRVCNDNDQCQGYCIADDPKNSRSGHCQTLTHHFGCFTTLESGNKGPALCID